MKNPIKIYIETKDLIRLKRKANEVGLKGKGAVSQYIIKVARERICFIDDNVVDLLKEIKSKR